MTLRAERTAASVHPDWLQLGRFLVFVVLGCVFAAGLAMLVNG